MATGMLTILFKNKGSNLKRKHFRPISILNGDYKMLAKVLANRIKRVIRTIISSTQAYSVGRDLMDTICTITDVVSYMDNDGERGIVLSMDLDTFFDRVEHGFLINTMKTFLWM